METQEPILTTKDVNEVTEALKGAEEPQSGEKSLIRQIVSSSNIAAVSFFESGSAIVEFNNDTAYEYDDVTREQFDNLVNAESVGSHFNKIFKPEHPSFFKIEPVTDEVVAESGVEIHITGVSGVTGFCNDENCKDRHGTLIVYFESPLGTEHPSLSDGFLESVKDKLLEDGFDGVSELKISPSEMQNTAYVCIDMGHAFAEQWVLDNPSEDEE